MYYSKIISFGSNSIYLGDCNIYKDPTIIHKLNIKSILCIKDYGFDMSVMKKENVDVLNLGLSHKNLFDKTTMKQMIFKTNIFIEDALKKGSVYVHCRSGINRSPVFVWSYLIYNSHGLVSPKEAYWKVYNKRPIIKPTYYRTFKKIYKYK